MLSHRESSTDEGSFESGLGTKLRLRRGEGVDRSVRVKACRRKRHVVPGRQDQSGYAEQDGHWGQWGEAGGSPWASRALSALLRWILPAHCFSSRNSHSAGKASLPPRRVFSN